MIFALAAHGTRGDIEPCAAVGVELLRRGHEVRMAVPPNLVGFVESAGLRAVTYGPGGRRPFVGSLIAARMTTPADGVNSAANLLEGAARLGLTAD